MHILFVHPNFPAQFGHLAAELARIPGWKCTFVTTAPGGSDNGVERLQYLPAGGATTDTHFCSRAFENAIWHCDGVREALKNQPELNPDVIVGHSGFGSTLFLHDLYPNTPIINLFEYYYRVQEPESDLEFRRDLNWPLPPDKLLRAQCRNAMLLLDLQNCNVGYSPTVFQRSLFPDEYQHKLLTIFDGIDRSVFHGQGQQLRPPLAKRQWRNIAGIEVSPSQRVVTYVSRGFEALRGFDNFMQMAEIVTRHSRDVVFIVVGSDRMCYGNDADYIAPHATFKDWVLARQAYDLSRIHFVGTLPPSRLAEVLAATDLHVYLTAPFILSWSMMDAMSCGAVVLGSSTKPVTEMIHDGHNGLLADFFKPDDFAVKALTVLKDPDAHRPLGESAERLMAEKYSLDAVLPRFMKLFEEAANGTQNPPTTTPEQVALPSADMVVPAPIRSISEFRPDVVTGTRNKIRSPFRG